MDIPTERSAKECACECEWSRWAPWSWSAWWSCEWECSPPAANAKVLPFSQSGKNGTDVEKCIAWDRVKWQSKIYVDNPSYPTMSCSEN